MFLRFDKNLNHKAKASLRPARPSRQDCGARIHLQTDWPRDTHFKEVMISCPSSSLPRYISNWLNELIHHSEQSMRQCALNWSHNLQLPYTRRLKVIWDQLTSNLPVYNLQLPYSHHGHHDRHNHGGHGGHGQDRQDRQPVWTRKDKTDILTWLSR